MSSVVVPAILGPSEMTNLVLDATFFGKGILLVLAFLSIMSWAVVFEKWRTLSGIRKGHQVFWEHCDSWLQGKASRQQLAKWCHDRPDLPLANLILETENVNDAPGIRRASERVSYLEIENLERYLILLSTAVTISPFLGLMGTVWGIMSSFYEMSAMQSANLTVVAPGIAEALTTTIVGLATAIPAVIFYNMVVRKIDLVANEIDRLRTLLEESVGGGHGNISGAGQDLVRRPDAHGSESL